MLDWMSQLSTWEWVAVAVFLLTILYLFYLMVYWRGHFGEPMELRYESGFSGVEGTLDGEFELVGQELYFRDLWKPSQTHFRIPLEQISHVSTPYGELSTPAYWAIGAHAILGQRNFLEISLRDPQAKTQVLRFSTHRHSKASFVWRKRLQEMIKPYGHFRS